MPSWTKQSKRLERVVISERNTLALRIVPELIIFPVDFLISSSSYVWKDWFDLVSNYEIDFDEI